MATTTGDAVEVKLFGKWSFEEVEVRGLEGAGGGQCKCCSSLQALCNALQHLTTLPCPFAGD